MTCEKRLSALDLASFFIQVKYILENNLDDAISAAEAGLDDLTFSEEVYDERGQIVQVILELVNTAEPAYKRLLENKDF